MVVLYALLSAVSYGAADFMGGFASRKNPALIVVAWSQAAGLVTALILAPLVGVKEIVAQDLFWGMAAGICGAAGVGILFKGLASGQGAIVSPAAALVGAAVPVLFGFLTGERPALLCWAGVVLSLPAILLLSSEKTESKVNTRFSLRSGISSGIAFSGFFILISKTGDSSGLFPLLAARAITVPLFFLTALFFKRKIRPETASYGIIIFSGFLDMLANVFYLLAVRTGFLVIAVILTAMYPAPTVLLQRIHLKEKLTAVKVAGLVLAISGAALIGVGR